MRLWPRTNRAPWAVRSSLLNPPASGGPFRGVSCSPVSGRQAARALMRAVLTSTSRSMDRHSFSMLGSGSCTVLSARVLTLCNTLALAGSPSAEAFLMSRD